METGLIRKEFQGSLTGKNRSCSPGNTRGAGTESHRGQGKPMGRSEGLGQDRRGGQEVRPVTPLLRMGLHHTQAKLPFHTPPQPSPRCMGWCGLPSLGPWQASQPRERTLAVPLVLLEMGISAPATRENRSRPPHRSLKPTSWSLLLSCLPEMGVSTGLPNLARVLGGAEPNLGGKTGHLVALRQRLTQRPAHRPSDDCLPLESCCRPLFM